MSTGLLGSATLAALALLGGLASPVDARAAGLFRGADEVVVAELRRVEAWTEVASARDAIAALGGEGLPPLFELLVQGVLPTGEGAASHLDAPRLAAAYGALGGLPSAVRRDFLRRLCVEPFDAKRRLVALDLAARFGAAPDLVLVLDLATGVDPLPREIRLAAEHALGAILARRPRARREVARFLERAPPALHEAVVRAVGAGSEPDRIALLADMLGASDATDALVLREIRRSPAPSESLDLWAASRIRGYLTHRAAELRVLAIECVAHVADREAVADLIALLEDDSSNVRASAHGALKGLTRLSLPPDVEAWDHWHSTELDWWADEAEACREVLLRGDAPAVPAAVRSITLHTMDPDGGADLLRLVLSRAEPELVALGCKALGAVGSRVAVVDLVAALDHADEGVVEEAWRALRKITGWSLDRDPSGWRRRTGLED